MARVAVTGFGVVSPVGTGQERFFAALQAGRSAIGPVRRFDASTFPVQLAAEVTDLPELDGLDRTAASMDYKVGFALVAAEEALRQAGVERFAEDLLLMLGTGMDFIDLQKVVFGGSFDYRSLIFNACRSEVVPLKLTPDFASVTMIVKHGRPGMVVTDCSACASGAQAIGNGFRAVRSGRYRRAFVGGFDSLIHPFAFGGFSLLGALTDDNGRGQFACRPFDSARRGTVLGEGAAMFVLEDMDRARAEGKRVLAEICGYGSTMDAHNLSAPDPDGDGADRAMRAALHDARIRPEQVDHISTHGTGTRLNDEVEAAAIRRVFDGRWERIPVAAVKSVTGHLIGAAGPVELAACMLPLLRGVLPPNTSLSSVGKGCELDHVTRPGRRWDGEYVLSNSFGFGGQNAVLVARRADA